MDKVAITTFLENSLGRKCLVVLSNGSTMIGYLCTIDRFFNLVMRDVDETVNSKPVSHHSHIFVRGNFVSHVAPTQ